MFVRSYMTSPVVTVKQHATLKQVLETLQEGRFAGMPVVDNDGHLVGMITVWDIHAAFADCVLGTRELTGDTKVSEVMSTNVTTILPEEIIEEAAYLMEHKDIWMIPVVNDLGQLVGIITETDIHQVFVEMLGLHRPGTRITVRVEEKPGQLAEIVNLVLRHNVSIISVAAFQPEQDYRNIVIRIATHDARSIVQELRQQGIRVLHVSQVWE
jgi:acetoin utilization protein AcuB